MVRFTLKTALLFALVAVLLGRADQQQEEAEETSIRNLGTKLTSDDVVCRGSDYDYIPPSHCRPQYSLPVKQCNARIRKCKCQYGANMKWTGKGCSFRSGDGGCQCLDYCGYNCEKACLADPRCQWDGTCSNIQTGIGGPIVQCIPTSAPTPEGCFSADTVVTTQDGRQIAMDKLTAGEFIQDISSDSDKVVYSEVIAMLHREDIENPMVELELDLNSTTLTLTPKHLVLVLNEMNERQFIFAKSVEVGYRMLLVDQKLHQTRIAHVVGARSGVMKRGLYAPCTTSGTFVVNGVVVSVYAYADHNMLHKFFAPLRFLASVFGTHNLPQWYDSQHGIYWYTHIMGNLLKTIKLFFPVAPASV